MKRITLLIALVAIATTSIAQDIIVTRSQTRIEGKVLEISDTEVKYNKQEAPNGPSLVLPTSEIVTILFANGEVVNFQPVQGSKSSEVQHEGVETTQEDPLPIWQDTVYEEFPIRLKSGKEIIFRTGTPLNVQNGKRYYGEIQLTKKEYEEVLTFCTDAYELYNRSKGFDFMANTIAIPSVVYGFYGDYMLIRTLFDDNTRLMVEQNPWKHVVLPLGTMIGGLMLAYFGFQVKADKLKEKANSIFNQSCAWNMKKKMETELTFVPTMGGVGIILTF